jgi:hypothetical protein
MRRITPAFEGQVFQGMVQLGTERFAPAFSVDSPTAEIVAGMAGVLLRKTGGNVRGDLAVRAFQAAAAAEARADAVAFRNQERSLAGIAPWEELI